MYDCDLEREVLRLAQELRVYDCGAMTRTRLGRKGDGGYVVLREPLNSCGILYSYGIGDEMSFELDFLLSRPQAAAILYDPFIDKPPKSHPRAGFLKEPFAPRTLQKQSMMKIDVEGAEWDILPQWSIGELVKLDQLVIEFHFIHVQKRAGLSPYFSSFYQRHMDRLNIQLFTKYRVIIGRLNRIFRLFHIHVNNSLPPISVGDKQIWPLIECSFVNRDLVPWSQRSEETFPIVGLDYPNKTDRPDAEAIKPPEKLC